MNMTEHEKAAAWDAYQSRRAEADPIIDRLYQKACAANALASDWAEWVLYGDEPSLGLTKPTRTK